MSRTRGRRRQVAATLGATVVIVGVLGGLSAASGARQGRHRPHAGRGAGPSAVEVAVARRGSAREEVTVSGVVAARATVDVASMLPGPVRTLAVVPGQRVRAGQLLAVVSDSLANGQLALAKAAAATANAKLQAARAGPRPQAVAVAKATLEKAESTLSSARSTYQDTLAVVARDHQAGIADALVGLRKAKATLSSADQVLNDAQAAAAATDHAALDSAKAALSKARTSFASAETSEQTAITVDRDAEAARAAANALAFSSAEAVLEKAKEALASAETSEQTAITVDRDAEAQTAAANAAAVASAEAALSKAQADAAAAATVEAEDEQAVLQAQGDQDDSSSDAAPADANTADATSLANAEAALSNAVAATTAADAALAQASEQLSAAEAPPPSIPLAQDAAAVTQAQQAVSAAQLGVSQASEQLRAAEAPPPSATLAKAAAGVAQAALSVRQADLTLAEARTPTTSARDTARAALSAAVSGLTVARAELALSAAPPRPSTLQPLVAAAHEALVAVHKAQATVAEERITAPIGGTIVSVGAVENERVGTGAILAVLESRTLTIQAALAQEDLPTVRVGEPAVVTAPGAPSSLPATVAGVGAASTPGATSFPVTLALSSDPAWLRPGEVVAATITTRSYPSAVLIPAAALVSLGGATQVFVVSHGTGHSKLLARRAAHRGPTKRAQGSGVVRLVGVHVEITDGTTAMVTGLAPGTEVVTFGQTYLARGDRVSVVGTGTVPSSLTGSAVGGLLAATALPPSGGHAVGASGRRGGHGAAGG